MKKKSTKKNLTNKTSKKTTKKKPSKRKTKKVLEPHWSRTLIVKRKGHNESFDERKIYASCYHAIRMASVSEVKSEAICEKIMFDIKKWLKHKKVVNSKNLFKHTIAILKKHDKDAAYLYESFRDIN